MSGLETALARHLQLELPSFPDNDDFSDWVSELYEADGYYVGLAKSLINGEKLSEINRSKIKELDKELERFSELHGDFSVYQNCREYLDSLKQIVSLL